jgi:hypothetical protein
MRSQWRRVLILGMLAAGGLGSRAAEARTIRFSGYEWDVKAGNQIGPGPNDWRDDNVWVDINGHLHLKISRIGNRWYAAEVTSRKRFGFGTYQFQVTGAIDKLDPHVVLGLFNYKTPDVGPDLTNELDVELTRWGHADGPNLHFTAWPAVAGVANQGKSFFFNLAGNATTHRFLWRQTGVVFQSLRGHRNDNRNEIARWQFTPRRFNRFIPQKPMPVHLNLWMFEGTPTDGKEVEVIVKSFTYKP